MKNTYFRILSIFVVFFFITSNVQAWVWSPTEGRFISPDSAANSQKTAEDLFQSALKLREQKGKERDTLRLLQQVVKLHNDSAYAPEAQFLIAKIFEEQQKPLRAAAEYKKVVREFPRSQRVEEAIEQLFKIGNYFLTGEKQKLMGVAIIPVYSKAVDLFKFIVEQAPYGPFGDQAQLRLGLAYRKMANYAEAVSAFQTLVANYPSSPLVDEAHYQLAETSYELSQNASRDQSTAMQASLHLNDFIKQYGSSSQAERAKILKERLDNQDAEKNYRIGLYYEKQGSVDSALIYYEDVAARYGETEFGQKAAKRLQALEQPIKTMEKGQAAVQQRIAEVRSMLEAIEQEEKTKGKKSVPETGDLKKQLKQELTSLTIGQKELKNEARDNYATRKKAFKERQKNVRAKFKTFKARQKQLLKNSSPELQEVLDKWQASLIAEQEELTAERNKLAEIKNGLKQQKAKAKAEAAASSGKSGTSKWFGWVPSVPVPNVPHLLPGKKEKVEKAADFNKKWNKYQKERGELIAKRTSAADEIAKIQTQIQAVEQQEFESIKNLPDLDRALPAALTQEKQNVDRKKAELDESIQSFEQMKKEYEKTLGADFVKNLSNDSYVSKLAAVHSLIASGQDLSQHLSELESRQNSLSESWIAEQEKLTTMSKAFEETQTKPAQVEPVIPGDESATQAEKSRMLKKRMKYLEREIRSRIDQIQDWQRDNAKRMKKLNELLKPPVDSKMNQTAQKVLSPAKGTYKLTKAFFMGLEDNDQKLIEQADAEVKKSQVPGAVVDERVNEIRQLQEEIELQSVLIQGRQAEIDELQGRLSEFQKQAQTIPGFSYQSLLIERIPTDLAHSVSAAKRLIGVGNREEIQKRLGTESVELRELEQKIKENKDQIEIARLAMDQKKGIEPKAAVLPFVSGSTETLPQEGSQEQETNVIDDQNKAQTKLIQAKAEINVRQSEFEKAQASYYEKLLGWFQTEGSGKFDGKTADSLKKISSQKESLQKRTQEIRSAQADLLKKETAVAQAQKQFVDQRLSGLENQLEELNNPSDSSYQALMNEIKSTHEIRDSLIRDLSTLQSS